MMADSEKLASARQRVIERAYRILSNRFPNHEFYYLVWGAVDTEYTYGLFVKGRANAQIRNYTAGVIDALKAVPEATHV